MAGKKGGARPIADEKKRRFAEFWLKDPNLCIATAWRKVYDPEGKNKDASVWASASKLIRDAKVQERIKELQIERGKRVEPNLDKIIIDLMAGSSSNIADYYHDWGTDFAVLKSKDELTREQTSCIESITVVHSKDAPPSVKLKLYNKRPSQDMLMKHLGAYIDTVLLKGTGKDGAIQIEELDKAKDTFIGLLAERHKQLTEGKQKRLN